MAGAVLRRPRRRHPRPPFSAGRYERLEGVIQELLGVDRELASVEGAGVEAEADWDHLRRPETYLGYGRSEHFCHPPASGSTKAAYETPRAPAYEQLVPGQASATIGREKVVFDQAGAACSTGSKRARIPLVAWLSVATRFRELVDGDASGPPHGTDIDENAAGARPLPRLVRR